MSGARVVLDSVDTIASLKSHKRRKWDNGCPNCWRARATLLATDLCDSHFLDWLRVSAGFLPIGNGK
jgi:hypothetical protein